MLIVDLHALQAINLLHFIHDIARERGNALQPQNVMRLDRPIDNGFAFIDHLAIMNSCRLPSRSVMIRRCLPFVSLPNETVPVTSTSTPAFFGERASNSSATRGSPPVISRVLCDSMGIRASTSPTSTVCPSLTVMSAPIWNPIVTG